ncbi:hypothetical protein J3R82DRAFT_9070 [Butyriboletus roseoflavus]|nr:hypothetical protein J3R82DRAFT_9070 [Butyriboletus roseoflavus]
MPSFLNKVFGYKKNDDRDAARPTREASDSTLLDGKYEAIPPVLSPSAATFAEAQSSRELSFFTSKSRAASQKPAQKRPEAAPTLTLRLPGLKENLDSRALSVVFEADPDSQTILDDAVIAAKRLNPLEALILIRACAQAITERGLETLGVMHPHWLSASPDVQRKLISLFIRSLTPQSRITTLSPTPTAPTSAFENELHYTRSSHDVAAVLRWGLRHLSLENGHFGKDSDEWAWYNAFFHAERNASYPPRGFSELLLPQLPTSHIELLTATLSLVSSLACHAELNSISGSKLSKFLGIWLLVATRGEPSDDWNRFYARWERAGRILEHLFLARLREESLGQRLPTRLQELVKYYPYSKGSLATEDELLSRPRFSTHQYDALFVRVETLLTHDAEQPKQHPIQLLLEAFQLPFENPSGDEHVALWSTLKTTASEEATSSDPEGLQFTRIFVDDTVQLLSLIPADNNVPTSPIFLASPISKGMSRKPSSSFTKDRERTAPSSNANNGSTPTSPTLPSSPVITDWAQFSLSGFGETPTTQPLAALSDQDDDVEITQPRISRKSSRHRGKSLTRRRRSEDNELLNTPLSSQSKPEPSIIETKLASVHVIQIDEAFIDFWSDAIVDPISANWPTFVICGLKDISGAEQPIRWLVIEQAYSRQQPQRPRVPSPDGHRGRSPRPSFRSDISGFRINSMFSSARKRLSVFSKSVTDLDPKKSGGKTPIVGELGEVLVEEEPTIPPVPPIKVDHHFDGNALGAAVTTTATASIADQLEVDEIFTVPIAGVSPTHLVPVLKESDPVQVVPKTPSVEPTPQSGGHDAFYVLSRPSVTISKVVSVEQGSPLALTLDVVNAKVDAADPVTRIAPLAADTFDLRPTQDTGLPAELPSIAESPVAEEVQIWQGEDPLVARLTDGDERLPAEFTGEPSNVVQVNVADGSRGVSEHVVMSPAPVKDEAPERIAEEPRVPSRQVPVGFLAASTVESVGQDVIDDDPSVSAPAVQEKLFVTETRAHLEPDLVAAVVDADEEDAEVAEVVEVPTPAPGEFVVLVEETPGPEVSVDVDGRAGVTQNPADAALPLVAAATLRAEEESATQVAAIETEHTAGQSPVLATEVQSLVDAPLDEVEAYVSAAQDDTLAAVEAQTVSGGLVSAARSAESQDTGTLTPVPEDAALVYDTPGPEVAAEACEPVEAALAGAPESEAVEDKAPEPHAGAKAPPTDAIPLAEDVHIAAELPTRFADTEPVVALSTEAAIAALATTDEVIARKAVSKPTPDAHNEDAEARSTPTPESAPVEDTLEVVTEASEPIIDEDEDVALSASARAAVTPIVILEEPVTRDVQFPIEIEEPSTAFVSRSAHEAANGCIVAVSVPGVGLTEVEAQLEPRVVHPVDGPEPASLAPEGVVSMDIGGPKTPAADTIVASRPQGESGGHTRPQVMLNEVTTAVPAVEIDEISREDDPKEGYP